MKQKKELAQSDGTNRKMGGRKTICQSFVRRPWLTGLTTQTWFLYTKCAN